MQLPRARRAISGRLATITSTGTSDITRVLSSTTTARSGDKLPAPREDPTLILAVATAQPGGAGWAVGNTLTTTLAQSICEIQVDDEAINPRIARASQGNTVGWSLIGSATRELVETQRTEPF